MFVSKVGRPLSNSWSTTSQPDFVRAFGRRKASTKSPGQDFVHRVAQKLGNLEKAVAVCGMRSGVPEEHSGKVAGC